MDLVGIEDRGPSVRFWHLLEFSMLIPDTVPIHAKKLGNLAEGNARATRKDYPALFAESWCLPKAWVLGNLGKEGVH